MAAAAAYVRCELLVKLAFVFAFLQCVSSIPQAKRVLLRIKSTDDNRLISEIVASEPLEQEIDFELHSHKAKFLPQGKTEDDATIWKIHYIVSDVKKLAYAGSDPRMVHGDWIGDNGIMTGMSVVKRVGEVALTVPSEAEALEVTPPRQFSSMHRVSIPVSEKFNAQGVPTNAQLVPEYSNQVGERGVTKNLVILPDGFRDTPEEKSLFLAATVEILNLMRQGKGGLLAAPWDRYISLLNYFVVWQPSPQSGASFPKGPSGGGGKPPTNVEVIVNDNLNCEYGRETVRFLSCSYSAVQSVAAASGVDPTTSTSIVIVNSNVYGGSGGSRVGAIYLGDWVKCTPCGVISTTCECTSIVVGNQTFGWRMATGNSMLKVFLHELGHADAALVDEYDYGRTETQDNAYPNCAYSPTTAPWKEWIGNTNLGVSDPVPSCSFSNYYKATPDMCLMSTEASPEYCAACATQVTRAIYRDTTSFTGQRCPRESETIVITTRDESHYLAVSSNFLYGGVSAQRDPSTLLPYAHNKPGYFRADSKGRVPLRVDRGVIVHEWRLPSGQVIPAAASPIPYLKINGKDLGVGEYVINFTVTDQTQFVVFGSLSTGDILKKGQTKVHTFKIKVVSEQDPVYKICTRDYLEKVSGPDSRLNTCDMSDYLGTRYYCGVCEPGKICNATYPKSKFEAQANTAAALKGVEGVVFGVGGAVVVASVLLFMLLFCVLGRFLSKSVDDIMPVPKVVKWGRIAMLVASVLTMVLAIASIAIAVYVYHKLAAFGKILAIIVIIFAGVIYLVAFCGFTAAYFRSIPLLVFNGILLTLCVLGLIIIAVIVFYTGDNIDSQSFKKPLVESWVDYVKSQPASMCSFQATFKCSGFDVSCHRGFHSQCPRQCEITNSQNINPCFDVFRKQVKDNFIWSGIVVIVMATIMFLALLINWALCFCTRQRKERNKARLTNGRNDKEEGKLKAVLRNLSLPERNKLKQEAMKVGTKDGWLTPPELKTLFKKALGVTIVEEEIANSSRHIEQRSGRVRLEDLMNEYTCTEEERRMKEKVVNDGRVAYLDKNEVEHLFEEFRRIDNHGEGSISVADLKAFYRRLYTVDPDPEDLDKALNLVGNDKNGRVNFIEFAHMFAGKVAV